MQQLNLLGSAPTVRCRMEGHFLCIKPSEKLSSNSSLSIRKSLSEKHSILKSAVPSQCRMQASNTATGGIQADSKEQPKEAKLWGGRFEKGVTPAVEKFGQSVSYDRKLYKHDLMGSRAHASMLAKQGIITVQDRDAILNGIDEIEKRIDDGKFNWRADREDVHMNVEAALIELVGEPAKKLHTARSRNDQVVTDVRLWCRDAINDIVQRIKYLQVSLVQLARENEGLVVPGYTHLQRAQPLLLQHLLLAFVEMLERDASRLLDCQARLNFSPLGACALAGTGLPIDRHNTAEALGFTEPMRNSVDAVADRDFLIELLGANSIIAIHLSRLAEEWVLWASEEFGFLTPSDAVSTGSSIMPQKKNPDPMELVRGKSARVIGDLTTVLVLCKGLPMAYNRDLQEDKEPLFDSVETINTVLDVTARQCSFGGCGTPHEQQFHESKQRIVVGFEEESRHGGPDILARLPHDHTTLISCLVEVLREQQWRVVAED